MKNILLGFICCLLFVITLAGCSSSHQEVEANLKLFAIDSNTFEKYYNLWFPNSYSELDTSGFHVLTEKTDDNNIEISKFEPIKVGEIYRVKLFTVDSLVSAELNPTRFHGRTRIILDPNILFWDNGKIMIKVYFSKDFKGKYVLKGKIKLK